MEARKLTSQSESWRCVVCRKRIHLLGWTALSAIDSPHSNEIQASRSYGRRATRGM